MSGAQTENVIITIPPGFLQKRLTRQSLKDISLFSGRWLIRTSCLPGLDKTKMALGRIPASRKMGKDILSRMLRVNGTKEGWGKAGTNMGVWRAEGKKMEAAC